MDKCEHRVAAVVGKCPSCGEEGMYLDRGGFVTCGTQGCMLADDGSLEPVAARRLAKRLQSRRRRCAR